MAGTAGITTATATPAQRSIPSPAAVANRTAMLWGHKVAASRTKTGTARAHAGTYRHTKG